MCKRILLPIIIFIGISAGLYVRAVNYDTKLSSDQMFFRLAWEDQKGIGLGDYRIKQFDRYVPFQLTNWLVDWQGDDLRAYHILLPILVFVYLGGVYAALCWLTNNRFISASIAVVSLMPRLAFGSQFWGIIETGHAIHRSFFQPFVPLIVVGYFLALQKPRQLLIIFLLLGLISAFYPTQGAYLALVIIGHYFLFGRQPKFSKTSNREHVGRTLLFGLAFLIGLGAFIIQSTDVGVGSSPVPPGLVNEFNQAIRFRFDYTFYPGSLLIAPRTIAFDILPFLVIGWLIWKNWSRLSQSDRRIIRFGNQMLLMIAWISFGLPLAQELYIATTNSRILVFDQFGTTKFFYLVGFIDTAILVRYLQSALPSKLLSYFLVGLLLVSTYSATRLLSPFVPALRPSIAVYNPEIDKLCQWAQSVDRSSKIMFDDFSFRYCAKRQAVVNFKEGMVWLYARSPQEFIGWSKRAKKQAELYKGGRCDEFSSFGHQNQAQYMILPNRVECNDRPVIYQSENYHVYEVN